jgi:predicted dehydrogenase
VAGAALIGVYDLDPARAAEVSRELGVTAFESLDALLESVECAVIAVPTTAHAEVALRAIDRGVGLLIEKPLVSTLDEADAVLAAAEARGVVIATGHIERFNGALRACEPYLDSPRFIESHRLAPFGPRGTDVAVVLDLMIHDIDLVLGLAQRPVAQVDAVGVPVLTPSVDIANARIRFEGGAVANITASRISREKMRKIRLFQSSGYISLDLGTGTGEFLRLRPDAAPGLMGSMGAGGIPPAALEGLVERIELTGDGKEPLRAELESFVSAARGEGTVVVTGEDGRRALAVALDIERSIQANVLDPRAA